MNTLIPASLKIKHTVKERFLKYVQVDTQSDPNSTTFPTTEKQKDLSRILVQELLDMGIEDAHMDQWGYVYATVPANTDKEVPVICFCSHVDTSPDSSGTGVVPIVHEKYDGSDIVLPKDENIVLSMKDHPELANQIGNDLVTASGDTLLGADDKAGLAEIMDAVHHLVNNPDIKHGKIRLLFTPDEEVGKGVDNVDMEKLGADFGYTIDGSTRGYMQDETFSADAVVLTLHGLSAHPGFAKGRFENATKIAADILARLPKDSLSPETTEDKEGFIHPLSIEGIAEKTVVKFIIRDFETAGLKEKEAFLEGAVQSVMKNYPNSSYDFEVIEQYRNMKEVLDKYPQVADHAMEAIRRAGFDAKKDSIRGGTDGSRLSFMGLPCPNIFTGGHAYHSKYEWVTVQDMEKAVETIVHLCMVWEENA